MAALLISLIIPVVVFISGYMMAYHPPEKINGWNGYRTRRSRRNRETWLYANKYCGKMWMMLGAVFLAASVAVWLFFRGKEALVAACLIAMIAEAGIATLTIIPVERALRRHFDEKGQERGAEKKGAGL